MVGLELLAQATTAGLDVTAAGERLIVRGPRSAEAIARRLLAHKADVLAALDTRRNRTPAELLAAGTTQASNNAAATQPGASCEAGSGLPAVQSAPRCRRCGSAATLDVTIHEGASTRRDCARCGRFIAFTAWYGKVI